MRRVMLLAFSVLVLRMAAFADPIPSFDLQIGPPLTAGNFSTTGFGNRACATAPITATSCSTPNYFNGQNITGGTVWVLNLVAPNGRILLDITSLTPLSGTGHCNMDGSSPPSNPTCNFSGTVTAFGTSVPGGTFTDTISGTLTRGPNDLTTATPHPWLLQSLTGTLGNTSGVITDSNLSVENVYLCRSEQAGQGCGMPGSNGRIRTGFGEATLDVDTPIPEPGTLALLGSGVIGLTGMARRKLKLGR